MDKLSYEPYNKAKLAVRGPEKYDALIKTIGGRWNSRMKGGPGWMLDVNKEGQIKTLIHNIQSSLPQENNESSEEEEDNNITSGVVDDDNVGDDNIVSSYDQEKRNSDELRPSQSNRREYSREHEIHNFRESNDPRERREYRGERREYRGERSDPREYNDRRERGDVREYRGRPESREYSRGSDHREVFQQALVDKYRMNDNVDNYYSKFNEKTRMKKNNHKQTRNELSESESEDEYDSDELESLTQTLSKLNKKVESLKNKSRGRKHKKRDRH
jgi:hypothetical protein